MWLGQPSNYFKLNEILINEFQSLWVHRAGGYPTAMRSPEVDDSSTRRKRVALTPSLHTQLTQCCVPPRIEELVPRDPRCLPGSSQVTRRWRWHFEKRAWQSEKEMLVPLKRMNVYFSGTFPHRLKHRPKEASCERQAKVRASESCRERGARRRLRPRTPSACTCPRTSHPTVGRGRARTLQQMLAQAKAALLVRNSSFQKVNS